VEIREAPISKELPKEPLQETPKEQVKAKETPPPPAPVTSTPSTPTKKYDTLLQFASVELEGRIDKK